MRRCMMIFGLAALTAATPVGTDDCPGVRPGSRLLNNFNGLCTANFLFRSPDGTRYIGKPEYKAHGPSPIKLQAHGDPSPAISFRNIWVRELP